MRRWHPSTSNPMSFTGNGTIRSSPEHSRSRSGKVVQVILRRLLTITLRQPQRGIDDPLLPRIPASESQRWNGPAAHTASDGIKLLFLEKGDNFLCCLL